MSKPKDILVAVRFTPKEMPILELVTKQLGTSPSKWILGLAREAIERHASKIGAAMPGQEPQEQSSPPTDALRAGLPGHGGVASSSSSTEGEMGNRTRGAAANVSNAIVRPATFLTDKSGQPVAGIPTLLPPPVVPAWRHQPPKPPTWNGVAVVQPRSTSPVINMEPEPAPVVMPTPVKKFECQECKDEGAGILKECICGRYKDQQGRVQRTPDHVDGPRDWGHAFALLEGMDVLERSEQFAVWLKGKTLPTQWRDMVRDAKISWLNLSCPLV